MGEEGRKNGDGDTMRRGGGVMGGKAKTWNRLRDTLKRSQLRKARKEAEKQRKRPGR